MGVVCSWTPSYTEWVDLCRCKTKAVRKYVLFLVRVPTQTGTPGKPGKMGRHFPVREKSGNFEQTGKVREIHTKYWKTQEI